MTDTYANEPPSQDPFDQTREAKKSNRFVNLVESVDGTTQPPANENRFLKRVEEIDNPQPTPETSTAAGSFRRSLGRNIAPAAAGLATFGVGAELGAAAGLFTGPAAPVAVPALSLIGGLGTSILGAEAASAVQSWALSKLPDSWREAIGQDERQQQEDEKKHGTASFLGGLVPFAVAMRPGGFARTALPENATALQRIMANPVTARAFGGAVMGGMEAGQELAHGDAVDWQKTAIATGFGVVFNKPTRIGERLMEPSARATRRVLGRPEPTVAPPTAAPPEVAPATEPAPPPEAIPVRPEVPPQPGFPTFDAMILAHEKGLQAPTLAEAGDLKVMGPGITEAVFQGGEQHNPTAAMTAHEAARNEAAVLGTRPTEPDLHATARRIEPETFERYDELLKQRDTFRKWIEEHQTPTQEALQDVEARKTELQRQHDELVAARGGYKGGPEARRLRAQIRDVDAEHTDALSRMVRHAVGEAVDTPEIAAARQHLQATDFEIRDMLPEIRAAYRRAADAHGVPVEAPAEAATPPAPVAPESLASVIASREAGAPQQPRPAETAPAATPEAPAAAEPVAAPPAEASPAPAPSPVPPPRSIEEQRAYIADDVSRRLVASGRPADEAAAYGQLWAAYYETRAARFQGALGTAEELFRAEGARIVGANEMRRGRPTLEGLPRQAPRSPTGPAARDPSTWSLLEFLAARGGIDPADPLISDVRVLTGGKRKFIPGFGDLVRQGGMRLDMAREAAVEAGYLHDPGFHGPEQATSTITTLLDAMENEIRGQRIYQHGRKPDRIVEAERKETVAENARHADEQFDEALRAAELDPENIDHKLRDRTIEIMTKEGERDPIAAYERAVMESEPATELLQERERPAPLEGTERIVGAAIVADGRVFIGPNHIMAIDAARKAGADYMHVYHGREGREVDGGFFTSKGRFVSRPEAADIANKADQFDPGEEWLAISKKKGVLAEALPIGGASKSQFVKDWQGQTLPKEGLWSKAKSTIVKLFEGKELFQREGAEEIEHEYFQRKRRDLTAEREAQGQMSLLGTERIGQGEQAQRAADQPLKPSVEQKPMDIGLFGDEKGQKELFQFAGVNASTADTEALSRAQRMFVSRVDPARIWEETGWYKSPIDGKWRFEIDDSKMNFKAPELSNERYLDYVRGTRRERHDANARRTYDMEFSGPLEKVIDHPELFKAYPELKDIWTHIGLGWGWTKGASAAQESGFAVGALTPTQAKQMLSHEIQHWIQEREGFETGMSPKIQARKNAIALKAIDTEIQRLQDEPGSGHNLLPIMQEAQRLISAARERLEVGWFGPSEIGATAYRSHAGEVESNNVMKRFRMTEERRRQSFPENTQPVPTSQMLRAREPVGFEGGTARTVEINELLGGQPKLATEPLIKDTADWNRWRDEQIEAFKADEKGTGQRKRAQAMLASWLERGPANEKLGSPRKGVLNQIADRAFDSRERLVEFLDEFNVPAPDKFLQMYDLTASPAEMELRGGYPVGKFFDKSDASHFQEARGKIRLVPGQRSIITLMKDANASTFGHETGHEFLDQLMRDADHPAAPDQLKTDAATTLKWLGAEDADAIKTRHHEKFARGFEQYLREGTAPSQGLARVFAQFRDWLVKIYETIRGLGKEISPDIRDVFDRMLSMEPQRTVIAPEGLEHRPNLHDIHEADAATMEPHEADAAMSRVTAEAERAIEDLPPGVRHELETELARIEAEHAQQQIDAAGAELGAAPGRGAGEPGQVGEPGGTAGPIAPSGGGGEEPGAVVGRGGEVGAAGAGLPGRPGERADTTAADASRDRQRAAADLTRDHPLASGPADLFGATESPFTDKAGNIRLENLTTRDDVAQAIRDAATENNDFIGDRRGVVTDGQVMDLAEDLGMDFRSLNTRKMGEAFNAEQIMAARKLLVQSAEDVSAAMKKAAIGTDEDLMLYAAAKDRHQMIQAQVAGITAEAGRALRAFRNIAGMETAQGIDQFIRTATGKTLFQLKAEAKLGATLETPQAVSKFIDDAKKRTFGRMLVEYWINGLLSGPATHSTNIIGNAVLMVQNSGPETAAAALIGRARQMLGREGEVVRFGELGARLRGFREGLPSALKGTAQSLRTGTNMLMPGEKPTALPYQIGNELAPRPMLDEAATYSGLMADAFGTVSGLRDSIIAMGALIKAGGVEGAPLFGAQYSHLGAIPDIAIRGVPAIPLGSAIRVPGRFLAAADSFFRAVNYSMAKNATAYRMASNEGLVGTAFDARVAEIRQNPSEAMMTSLSGEAAEQTLMEKGGKFLQALSHLSNTEIGGFPLLKFVSPFVHVAGNIINQALIKRTPLGFLSAEIRADLLGANGNIAQDKAMARILIGTGLAVTFGSLAAQGLASGSGPTDPKEAAMWRLAGNQANSVRIGDMWYGVQKLGPLGLLLGLASDLYDVSKSAAEGEMAEAAGQLIHAFSQQVLDQSMMKGPAELLRAINDSDRYGPQYVRNFLSGFVPYSVGMAQMAKISDPYSRQTRTVVDAIRGKIPGHLDSWFGNELFPKRDIWGEAMLAPDTVGGPGVTGIQQRQVSTDPVNVAMMELGIYPAPVQRKIRNVDLTDEQFDDFARIAGRMTKIRLDQIINSSFWATVAPPQRHDVIEGVIKGSRETARGVVMTKYPDIVRQAAQDRLDKARGED